MEGIKLFYLDDDAQQTFSAIRKIWLASDSSIWFVDASGETYRTLHDGVFAYADFNDVVAKSSTNGYIDFTKYNDVRFISEKKYNDLNGSDVLMEMM